VSPLRRSSLRSLRRQGACPLTRLPVVAFDCGFAVGVILTMKGMGLSALKGAGRGVPKNQQIR